MKAITEELCGHAFSASAISEINKTLDAELAAFATRRRDKPKEAYPYLILDARYERVREGGVIRSQAVLIPMGIDWEGGAMCSGSSWLTARAGRAGRTSCSG